MISVSGITKTFGRFTAVADLTFEVARGEILGFLGPNGAGKTTTMRILTGFLPPTRGIARVADHDILEQPIEAKRRIGYLPENPPIYPEMSVYDYVDFVARIKGVPARERKAKVDRALERCALGDVRSKLAGKLSKGYRQRVGLAQALVHEPEVLVLDEPTAGLDPQQINETRQLIKSLGGDHTVVLSTHILPEVSVTCERVVIINRGRLVAEGTPEALTERFAGASALEVAVAGDEASLRSALSQVQGVRSVTPSGGGDGVVSCVIESDRDVRSEVAAKIVGAGLDLLELRKRGVSLEEVYLRVISSEEPAARASSEPEPEPAA